MLVRYKKLNPDAPDLIRGSEHAAGIDLYNAGADTVLYPTQSVVLPTGIAIEIPVGYFGHVSIRSGLGFKEGLATHIGVVDSDFRGEMKIKLFNHGNNAVMLPQWTRLANLVIIPHLVVELQEVETLEETVRGESGYGSTGL